VSHDAMDKGIRFIRRDPQMDDEFSAHFLDRDWKSWIMMNTKQPTKTSPVIQAATVWINAPSWRKATGSE
jgi:hypothetical protein